MIRILIVDDEPLTRDFLKEKIPILNADCTVVSCCGDGQEALDYLTKEETTIDMILTDVKMPVMDGLEFSRRVREIFSDIPIIILSGFGEFELAQQAIQNEVSDYILKPIANAELKQVLQKMVNRIELKKHEEKEKKRKERLFSLFIENYHQQELSSQSADALYDSKPEENFDIVEAAIVYILKNYFSPISLSTMAEELNVSASYLSGIFHHKTGISYVKYLTRVRMEIAADYLDDYPAMPILEISKRTGFMGVKHFFYVFKKYFGMTPTEYRQRKQNQKKERT